MYCPSQLRLIARELARSGWSLGSCRVLASELSTPPISERELMISEPGVMISEWNPMISERNPMISGRNAVLPRAIVPGGLPILPDGPDIRDMHDDYPFFCQTFNDLHERQRKNTSCHRGDRGHRGG